MVDFIAAPPHYGGYRDPGNAGRSQTYYQASYRLHGIVYFEETDYRTFLSDPAFAPYPATRRRNLESSISIIRRSIGKSLAGGLGDGSAADVSELTGVKVEVRKSEAGRHYTKTVAAVGDAACVVVRAKDGAPSRMRRRARNLRRDACD